MNVVDKAVDDYWKTRTAEDRFLTACALYEAETAVLRMIAPRSYSSDDMMSFVYYHLHGEELPEDFFFRRNEGLERSSSETR